MNRCMALIFYGILLLGMVYSAGGQQAAVQLYDASWKFHRGSLAGAERFGYNDAAWRVLDLPHDWSIEDIPGTLSPFSKTAVGQQSTGFTVGGTAWYRKKFSVPAELKGKKVHLQFDGIYQNATVYINGQKAAFHPYGYTSFWVDLTPFLHFGTDNVVAVSVASEGEHSRWYSGSGIYRHVWLKTYHSVHITPWGVGITTPKVDGQQATVSVTTTMLNEAVQSALVSVRTTLLDPAGKQVAQSTSAVTSLGVNDSVDVVQELFVNKPQLWDVDAPELYTAVTELVSGSEVVERRQTKFGIRSISFSAVNGFQLNGKTVKLKGGCVHHDNGPLGARAFDRAEERRVELLKQSGYNALRSAHNPPSPAFLEACDRLGMLVIVEAFDMWREQKNLYDYHLFFDRYWKEDIRNMVQRDRNHPSVIMWSIGNEIPNRDQPEVVAVSQMIADYTRSIDAARPVTAAVQDPKPDKDPYFGTLDVAGYNYPVLTANEKESTYFIDQQRVPQRVMYTSESYPLKAFESWMPVLKYPWVIGDFVWTAFDYIGEAGIGWLGYDVTTSIYPWTLAYCGDIDICGWKRPQSYYRDVLWKEKPQLSLFVTPPTPSFKSNPDKQVWSMWEWHDVVSEWNFNGAAGKPLDVVAYSSCEEVELFLNGKSLGKGKTDTASKYMARWRVPYAPGELKAVGYSKKGKQKLESVLRTADTPAQISLATDRSVIQASGQDLAYITVELQDAKGRLNPVADKKLNFYLNGPGEIIGVANANPTSVESFHQLSRVTWKGKCLVIIKASKVPGTIRLTATAEGLAPAAIDIRSLLAL